MFKKYRYLFSLLLIFSLNVDAKSLLYKVTSEDSTVYILGSIHLAKPELYPLDEEIRKAYNKSDVLVVELDPSSAETMHVMQNSILNSGMYPRGKNLKTELSSKTYKLLKEYMQKTGIPLSSMMKMRPWVVMLQLSITEMMRLGYSPELGIDKHFLDQAKAENKRVLSLETAQKQMALLSKDDKQFQDRLLFYTLESMHEMEPMLDKMFSSWKVGEAKAFDKIMSMPLTTDPSLKDIYNDLIIKRNYTMTKKIEHFLKSKKNYFVVVGAGHVVGKEGIISLLKGSSYKVAQQ